MSKNKTPAEETAAQVEETKVPETQETEAAETPVVDETAQALEKAQQDLAAKEKTDAYASAKADATVAFLPVYDNLQRALAAPCQDEAFRKGVEMTMTQLENVLQKLGLQAIDCLGKPFDPNTQNAVMHVEDETVGESIVVEVFQTGFMLGDKVVREAMVKVAN
jgi:molecular chaperone GrpE